jgi:hypothetical protein
MVAISKSTIVSDIWENFYDRVNATVTDPNASKRTKWIYSTFPLEDIENRSIDWPVVVINPITISWEKFSLTKNYAMCSINIELYTTSAAKADEYTDKILDGIETSKDDLRDLGIELIYLTDRFSDVVFRGKNTIHTNTLNFSFRYVFEKTRTY